MMTTLNDIPHAWLVCAAIALQLVDLATTVYGLTRPGVSEANGLLAPIMRKIGALPTMLLVKGVLIGIVWWFGPKVSAPVMWFVIAVTGYVAVSNCRVLYLQAQRRRA